LIMMILTMMMRWRWRPCCSVYLPVILLIFLIYGRHNPSRILASSSVAQPHLFRSVQTFKISMWLSCQPHAGPPTWRTRLSLFVWAMSFDPSFTPGPTSRYTFQDHLTKEPTLQWFRTHILFGKNE
jgi:hypothetical protein